MSQLEICSLGGSLARPRAPTRRGHGAERDGAWYREYFNYWPRFGAIPLACDERGARLRNENYSESVAVASCELLNLDRILPNPLARFSMCEATPNAAAHSSRRAPGEGPKRERKRVEDAADSIVGWESRPSSIESIGGIGFPGSRARSKFARRISTCRGRAMPSNEQSNGPFELRRNIKIIARCPDSGSSSSPWFWIMIMIIFGSINRPSG